MSVILFDGGLKVRIYYDETDSEFDDDNITNLKAPCSDGRRLKEVLSNPGLGGFQCEIIENS